MSAAFTPGPWLVHATNRLVCQAEGASKPIEVENGAAVGDDLPNNICLLRDPDEDFSEDETLANGYLIAAAPSLYQALNELVSFCCAHVEHFRDYNPLTEEALAALAQARGEQS